jgi:hypothetical protein
VLRAALARVREAASAAAARGFAPRVSQDAVG